MSEMREAFEAIKLKQIGYRIDTFYDQKNDCYYSVGSEVQRDWCSFKEGWQAAQSVPGFVLVPVEPTQDQILAALVVVGSMKKSDIYEEVKEIYKRMLEKAPEYANE